MSRWILLVVLSVATALPRSAAYAPSPGECNVSVFDAEWHDVGRNREVPVRIYYPSGERAPKTSPVIVFSHGLGGSRESYAYLGRAWAAHGYVSVHLQHAGSDEAVFKNESRPRRKITALQRAASNPENYINRPRDVLFVIDRLAAANDDAASPLHGRLDLHALAVAGHSFGAYTVMALAGQAIGPAGNPRYFGPDTRIVAAMAMSSQPPPVGAEAHAYDRIRIPIFHLTGTKDESIGGHDRAPDDGGVGHTTAAGRRVAFDHTPHASAYLLTFKDGDHMVFSGRDVSHEGGLRRLLGATVPSNLSPATREAMQQQVVDGSLAFWDATLRGNADARQWFEGGGFARALGALGRFEMKKPG